MTDQDNRAAGRLLITGATGGMGRACAQLAAARGYSLVLADLDDAKLATLAGEYLEPGATTECYTLDVTRSESIEKLVSALKVGDGVDAIIHTVGVSPQMAEWDRIIAIDLVGTVEFLEAVRSCVNAGGCVVSIASMSAYMVPPNDAIEQAMMDPLAPGFIEGLQASHGQILENPGMAYAYAKKALKKYVADQAGGWGKENKRFVSICPGLIDTEMGRMENEAMENFEAMKSLVALGRLGEPEDIAKTALFLVSADAAYITGCDILVDGGVIGTLNREQGQPASS